MDIKEIAMKVAMDTGLYLDGANQSEPFYVVKPKEIVEFAEALISAYKAELLKEAGEPVLYAEFAEDGGWLGDASEYADHLEEPHALFTSDQVAAAILKATKPLEDQLAAAQEELRAANSECDLFRKNGRISDANEIATLKDQLAKAEQRVAEACAELADKMNPFPEPSAIGPEIRSGEWRKFVNEV